MKKILFSACLAAGALSALATPTTVTRQELTHSLIYPGLVEIDINHDGILDLIYSGEVREASSGRVVEDEDGNETQINFNTFQMVWNSATNTYDFKEFPYYFGNKPYFAVTDWNGDGITDFVCFGEASQSQSTAQFGLFINDGKGNFTRQALEVVDEDGEPYEIFDPKCVDFADFNSDGKLDLVVIGWKNDANGERRNYNAVLVNQGDNKFMATNTDLLAYGGNTYELALSLLTATDLNNDGYADFLAQGNVDNVDDSDWPVKNGVSLARTFVACLNVGEDAEGETILYDLSLADSPAHHYGHGGFEVFDYNNDGVPDIFVGGESADDYFPAGNFSYNWQLLQGRLSGTDISYTDVTSSQVFYNKDIRPLNDSKPFRVIDYTGNGDYDILLPGWTVGCLDGSGDTQAGWLFTNNGNGYSDYEHIPGASECAVFFTEDGVSGVRNYCFAGQSWDGMFFNDDSETVTGRMLLFTTNPNAKAARPDAPTNLSATVDDHNVTLEWSAPASAKANVTYEYYLKGSNGKFFHGVPAFVGGENDGIRTTLAQGRAFMAKKLNLNNLPDDDYEWGVQTVNASLQGSKFAAGGKFRIGEGGAGVNAAYVSNAAVVATEYYDLTGRKLNAAPEAGIAIKKDIREDGTTSVSKIIL